MINPNIASKVFQIFSQMAKTNFSIAVDEDNVKDLSTTEWRIIQEVGYGESNKEIAAKLFLSEGTVRNYLSTILAKLNLRDRTQLAIWSVQTGVTRRDFLKEIQNEIEAKASLLGIGLLVVLCVSAGFIGGNSNRPYSISAFMQVLAGMCRPVNVPMPWIVRFKNLKNPIPTFV